ncbi:DMT family transporter [Brevibacillus choshinensis]|uniref:DMT family transporter n=1 Tax=Brevibacillus choshinensis TaxID=54911 RepID=A0ABX7FLQ7_BRECH|nr:DMT family transporter [Brevibacillus choshinensis]QRG66668.1 DMT family transporter [Brevibacillus choshinensis]
MKNKQIIIGSILCMIASMSWGAMFPVAHIALQQIDPFYFSFLRYFFVTVILCGLLWVKEGFSAFRLEGRGRALVFFGTMAFTVYNMGVFLGQHLMGEAGTIAASIMEVLMPMISILLLSVTTKKMPPSYALTSIAIALAGALLVITNGSLAFFAKASEQLFPLLLIFAGVIGWVIYSIGGGRFSSWSTLRYSTLTCLLGTAVSFVVVAIASLFQWIPVPTWESVVSIKYEMAFMVLLPGLAALLSWNAGIKALTPLNGILYINLVPITTFILMSFQGYEISMFEFYGTLLVIFALIRNNHFQRKQLGYARNRKKEHSIPVTRLLE